MKLQLLSDLHLETEAFEPRPAPEAELLQAGAALKGPFVKAYTAFGWPAGETPALAG